MMSAAVFPRRLGLLCVVMSLGCAAMSPAESGSRSQEIDEGFEELRKLGGASLPSGNVKITVERVAVESSDRLAVDVATSYRKGEVQVEAGRVPPRGITVAYVSDGLAVALTGSLEQRKNRELTRQFLVTAPGSSASLDVIEETIQPRRVALRHRRPGILIEEGYVEVTGSGVDLLVHSATAEGVDLEIAPFYRTRKQGDRIAVQALSTRVRVIPGQPFVLMSDRTVADDTSRALFSYRKGDRERDVIVILNTEVAP